MRSGRSMVIVRIRSALSTVSHVTPLTVDTTPSRYCLGVGFNPFREHEKSALDIAMVVITFLAIVGVVGWALFAG